MKKVVRAFAHWFWILIICLVVGYFGGKELNVLIPPTYDATALVQLNAQAHTSTIIQPVGAYSALITSDSILGTALKDFPTIDRTALVTKELVVATDNASQTINISVTLSNAKDAAKLANELSQLLVTQQNAYIKQQYNKELQLINTRIANEKLQIEQLNAKIIATPSTDTATIQQLQSQVSQQQNLENQDIASQQSLVTQQTLYGDPLAVVQTATPPTKPSSITGQIPLTPVFIAVMVLIGIFIIYMLERSANRIDSVHTMQQKKISPVLGALRWNPNVLRDIPLNKIGDAKTPYAEECRVMMADVLFHAENAQAQTVAITSIKSRAGNSSIAAELATLLAQSKRRVLLVDANLGAPSLHKKLGVANEAGLAMMLESAHRLKIPATPGGPLSMDGLKVPATPGGPSLMRPDSMDGIKSPFPRTSLPSVRPDSMESIGADKFIMQTSIPNLFMMPAGKPSASPISLLGMPEMEQFLRWASQRGNYIVIDCPALTHAEAHVLGSLSDQTFLVIDATKDRVKQVESTKEELQNTGVKLSGFIINKLGRWI